MRLLITIFIIILICFNAKAQVFDVSYKDKTPTRTLLLPAQNAKAVVLLFPGGGGLMNLQNDGSTSNRHTFVRSKELWSKFGIDAVLVDTPYDLGRGPNNLRFYPEHQERIYNVVKYYKDKTNLPIWLFGHSMGTVSASEFANKNSEQQKMIKGIVLAGTYKSVSLNNDVTLPVLVIRHSLDGCQSVPMRTSEEIIKNRPKEVRSQLILIDGGIDRGDACQAGGYHGFNGTEDQLVKDAAEFILKK